MYSCKYLDNCTFFVVLPVYTATVDLKWNNQDVAEVLLL